MKCQSCEQTATVHVTDIVAGKKKERHLCADCAKKQQLLKQADMNINAILQSVFTQNVSGEVNALSQLT